MTKNIQSGINFIIYGKIGAGKDTVTNYLVDYFGYYKFRVADTIKRIITEKRNIGFDELENLKRTNPEIRDEHTDIGTFMGLEANINRCNLISNKKALDWTNLDKDNDYVISDGRSKQEIEVFLKDNAYGIFLSRETSEYSKSEHWTNQNLITNGVLYELIDEYPNQIIVVLNGGTYDLEKLKSYGQNILLIEFECNPELITPEILLEKIDELITNLIDTNA